MAGLLSCVIKSVCTIGNMKTNSSGHTKKKHSVAVRIENIQEILSFDFQLLKCAYNCTTVTFVQRGTDLRIQMDPDINTFHEGVGCGPTREFALVFWVRPEIFFLSLLVFVIRVTQRIQSKLTAV